MTWICGRDGCNAIRAGLGEKIVPARTQARIAQRPLVDPKAFDLAEHFLSDLEGDEASEDQKWQLAGVIQDAVENWLEHGS